MSDYQKALEALDYVMEKVYPPNPATALKMLEDHEQTIRTALQNAGNYTECQEHALKAQRYAIQLRDKVEGLVKALKGYCECDKSLGPLCPAHEALAAFEKGGE